TYRFAFPFLLAGAFASGCSQGSGSAVGSGSQDSGASGGTSGNGSGGTSASGSGGTGGSSSGNGGSDSGVSDSSVSGSGGAGVGDSGAGGAGSGGSGSGGAGSVSTMPGINGGAGPWGTPVAGGPAAGGMMVTGTVTVGAATNGAVGAGFVGFSLEKTHLTNNSLTGANAPLIALYKLIAPAVIRIGANDVERCTWVPGQPFGAGGPPFGFKIGTVMVDGLADFLNASGAKVIYGLNFSLDNVANDVAEATYASMKLGANLLGFEIGNELDKYGTWAAQRAKYEGLAGGVLGALPTAKLIGPASTGGGANSLSTPFAADESVKFPEKLVLLTQHYYLGASGGGASVGAMQTVKGDIPGIAATMETAATKNRIADGYRFGEANSFFGHGQPGVSDTLLEGLWAIDLMFVIAEHGASGINFHGGETGMDGTKPFSYTPITESNGVVQAAMPEYHGLLAFYLAGQGPLLGTTVTTANPNFTAYTVDYKADGSTMVVLNNKNATMGVQATVNLPATTKVTSASAIYLQGTPAGSLTAAAPTVTLAGAQVTSKGEWARNPPFTQTVAGNAVSVFVPPASAAIVRIQ
ncbi:MAG TPA: hypothetical protein VMU50_15830, partial [Polyangia bacterium]|nr:hypothetical protein [Polyangia bacterium]